MILRRANKQFAEQKLRITWYVLLVLLPSLSNHVISNNVPACVYGIISHDTLAFFASSDPPKDIPLLYHEI